MSFELLQPTDTMPMNSVPSALAFSSPMHHPHSFSASPHLDYSSKPLTSSPQSNLSTNPDFDSPVLESMVDQHHPSSPPLHTTTGQLTHLFWPEKNSDSHNQLESTTSRDCYHRGSEFGNPKNGKEMFTGSRMNQWPSSQPTQQQSQYHHWRDVNNNTILGSEATRRRSFDVGTSWRQDTRVSSPDVKSIYDDLGPSMHSTHGSTLPLLEPSSNPNHRPPISNEYYGDDVRARLTWMQSGDMHENNCGNQGMLEPNILHPQSQPNVYSSASSLYSHQRFIPNHSLVRPGIQSSVLPLGKLSIVDEPMADHSNFDDESMFEGMPPPPGIQQNQPDSPEESSLEILEPYPDMPEDFEAATTDPDARPRRQRLRYSGDKYTPTWVRHSGQAKEGFCDTCKPGKWLQLKNSAYWYHKQFIHGISSVSGKEFVTPLDHRWLDQEVMEGLCHQCHQWVPISNTKRKNTMLWFRHAHKCHVYHKPKNVGGKKR